MKNRKGHHLHFLDYPVIQNPEKHDKHEFQAAGADHPPQASDSFQNLIRAVLEIRDPAGELFQGAPKLRLG